MKELALEHIPGLGQRQTVLLRRSGCVEVEDGQRTLGDGITLFRGVRAYVQHLPLCSERAVVSRYDGTTSSGRRRAIRVLL